MGRKSAGPVVTIPVARREVRVSTPEGVWMRRVTIDPSRRYQRRSEGDVSTMSWHIVSDVLRPHKRARSGT